MTFTTYRQDGRLTLDVPQIAGAYGSGMISTYWYPHRLYSPLVQGVQFGHEQMGEVLVGNLVQEFGPDLQARPCICTPSPPAAIPPRRRRLAIAFSRTEHASPVKCAICIASEVRIGP